MQLLGATSGVTRVTSDSAALMGKAVRAYISRLVASGIAAASAMPADGAGSSGRSAGGGGRTAAQQADGQERTLRIRDLIHAVRLDRTLDSETIMERLYSQLQ